MSGDATTVVAGGASGAPTRPFSPFEWMLAQRYLRARGGRGFVSVIAGFSLAGIALSVAALIVVMAVMNGFRQELFEKILGLNGHVIVRPVGREFTDYAAVAARLKTVPGVQNAIGVIEGQVLASKTPSLSSGVYLRGIREDDLRALEAVLPKNAVKAGAFEGFDASGGLAIGSRLAETLKVQVGDTLRLLVPRSDSRTNTVAAPRIWHFPIRAIFEIGMSEYDSVIAFLPLAQAQKLFSMPGAVQVLEVFVDDPEHVGDYRPRLLAAAGGNLALTDWRVRNAGFDEALTMQRNVLFFILGLIVLVAALNIISGLVMLVRDKTHDIAILRTMGATRGAVMRVFFITGASIGVTGTAAGVLLGIVFSHNVEAIREGLARITGLPLFDPLVYFLDHMPAIIDPWEVAFVAALALSLSFLATLLPSWQAARLDPVEALRLD